MGYGLDQSGNRTQLTWPDGFNVGYCYDNLNRMTVALNQSTDCANGARLASYAYDPLSRRTSVTYGGGAAMRYPLYSAAGDLKELDHDLAGGTGDPQYLFGYTAAHELQTEHLSDNAYRWQPSTTGTTTYAAANSLNQYPSYTPPGIVPSPRGLTWDAKGNLKSGNLDGSGNWLFGYDAENRMLSACKPYVSGSCPGTSVNASYAYDPLGRRNHKSGTGVTARYFLDDGDDEIAEYDSGGNVFEHYVPGPAIDEPIAEVNAGLGAYWYFHTNHQGSVIAMSGLGGAVKEGPYTYDPFGNCYAGSNPCSAGEPYRFTGRRLDPETGLYYYRARCYSPQLGRFCQTDPVGYAADLNPYTYVNNNPTNRTDPTGNADDVTGGNWQEQQVLNSPAGQQGQLLGAAIGIVGGAVILGGVEIGAAILGTEVEAGAGAASVGGTGLKAGVAAESSAGAKVMQAEGRGPVKEIKISRSASPESAKHLEKSGAVGRPLTVDRAGAAARRAEALKGTPIKAGLHRDEAPPAVFKEGGAGASVTHVPPSDNLSAGAQLGNQLRDVPNGCTVTIGICK